ncbi:MAG: hypothetical protein NUV77_26150 [Thermoguttaceae bacterium]|jgi:CRISPR-associated protein Csx14|nr:hypothetical protein [Thermoguttaceae bacterium]
MNSPEPSFSVNVDETNPGQFYACCGLLELAHRLCKDAPAEARFLPGRFDLVAPGRDQSILVDIMDKLRSAVLCCVSERGDRATYPVRFRELAITLDWWLDSSGRKTPLKLWAGQQTSLRIVTDLRHAIRQINVAQPGDLFDAGIPLTGRFGVDPRAAWNALDTGFSPNEQQMQVETFPAVELLAAIGLQRFRPHAQHGGFCYATWSHYLGVVSATAAVAGAISATFLKRRRFEIVKRGSYQGFDYSIPIGE